MYNDLASIKRLDNVTVKSKPLWKQRWQVMFTQLLLEFYYSFI